MKLCQKCSHFQKAGQTFRVWIILHPRRALPPPLHHLPSTLCWICTRWQIQLSPLQSPFHYTTRNRFDSRVLQFNTKKIPICVTQTALSFLFSCSPPLNPYQSPRLTYMHQVPSHTYTWCRSAHRCIFTIIKQQCIISPVTLSGGVESTEPDAL